MLIYVNVLDSLTPIIMLNTLGCKSSVLFGTLYFIRKVKSVLQFLTHLSNLTGNE